MPFVILEETDREHALKRLNDEMARRYRTRRPFKEPDNEQAKPPQRPQSRLLPRAWMRLWDAYLAVWVPLKRAWAWVWHRKRLREYDAMMDRWLGRRE